MSPIWHVFAQKMRRLVRDRFALFWSILFPVLLLGILVLVFGEAVSEGPSFSPDVGLVRSDDGELAEILTDVLTDVADEGWFQLAALQAGDLARAKVDLEADQYHAVLHIPAGFSAQLESGVYDQYVGADDPKTAAVELFSRPYSQTSQIAAAILTHILEEFERESALRTGLMQPEDRLRVVRDLVSPEDAAGFSYVDFILPGVVLMGFLSLGLSSIIEDLVVERDRRILRRFFVTPIHPAQYVTGFLLHVFCIAVVQVLALQWIGTLVFGSTVNLLTVPVLAYLLYALAVMLSLGLLLAGIAQNADAANGLSNLLFYPLMFLGGLFFPISGIPGFLQIVVDINPVTYLSSGLRDLLGVFPAVGPRYLHILIPTVWLTVCLAVGLARFRWEPSGR